jgi:hypothetical protein
MDHPVKKGGDFVQSRGEAAPLCETRRQEQRATSGASLIVSRLMCQHKLPVYTSGPGFVANASLLTAETFALYDRVDGRTPLLGVIDQIKINVIADSFTSFIRLPNIIMFISTDGEPTDTSIDRFCMQLVDLVKKGIKVSSADNKKYTRKVCVVIQYIGDDPIVLEKYNKIDGMFSRIDVNDDDASEWEEINRNERFIRKYGHFSTQDIRMKIVMGAAVKQIGNADGNNRQEGCVPSV